MSHLWKTVQDEMLDEKKITKHYFVPSQRYQDARHFSQIPKVPRIVIGFSNRAQRFTGSNYLNVDSPFMVLLKHFCPLICFIQPCKPTHNNLNSYFTHRVALKRARHLNSQLTYDKSVCSKLGFYTSLNNLQNQYLSSS